ncbi:MAG: DnaB-like helicase N-terminal domain-containing protein, partial [Cyanobacteria bacterium J06638_22]
MQAEELTQELRLASATPQLPHNVEAEYAVIGGILIDPTAIARAQQILKPEYFYLQP